MPAQQGLLVAIVAAHQHAYLIIVVQPRQGQLMPETLLLRNVVKLARHLTQRTDDQSINAPGDRHRQNQHQQKVSSH